MVKTQLSQKQDFQEQTCTHCQKNYTKKCSIKKYCKVHKGQCFSCRHCIQPAEKSQLNKCSICSRLSSQDELLYDAQCKKYYCIHQFLNYPLQNSKSLKFPCSHKVPRKKFMEVLKNFCHSCGRRKPEKRQKRSSELYKCYSCLLKQKQKQSIQSQKKQEFIKSQTSHQDHLNPKSEFIVKEILKNQTQKQCIICLEQFDQEKHIPYMICIRQHMICNKCLPTVRACPLCMLKIDKKNCMPYRNILERIKLEKMASEKHQKFQKLLEDKKKQESQADLTQEELPQKEKMKKHSLQEKKQRKKLEQKRQKHFREERQRQDQWDLRRRQTQQNQQKNDIWNSNWLFKKISGFFKTQ